MIRRRPHFWLVCLLPLAAALGCQSLFVDDELPFDLRRKIPWKTNDDYERKPDRLIAIWSHDVLHTEGRPSQRGFGGRLLMYSGASGKAKKVNGDLVVYAYDLSKPPEPNNAPDRKYVFTQEQLKKLHQKNQLGDSYNVWLPWDEEGGPTKTIKLIVRFEPAEGSEAKPVVSEATENRLPGKDVPKTSPALTAFDFNPNRGVIQQTVMHAPPAAATPHAFSANVRPGSDAPAIKMQTTTIPLGPRLGRGAFSQSSSAPAASAPTSVAWGRPDVPAPVWGPPNPFAVAPAAYQAPPGQAGFPGQAAPAGYTVPAGIVPPAGYMNPAAYNAPPGYPPQQYAPPGFAPNGATPYPPAAASGWGPAHYGALPGSGAAPTNVAAPTLPAGEFPALPGTGAAANVQQAATWGAAQPATGRPLMRPRQMGGTIRNASPSQTAVPARPTMWGNGS